MQRSRSEARLSYPSDLTDAEWEIIAPLVPEPTEFPNLQTPMHTAREMLNAIRYRTRTGIAWRALPHDFPPWSTVYKTFQKWNVAGTLENANAELRVLVRRAAGRNDGPSAAILDSQSVKSTDVGGERGFDAGKR